jgi:hypothetical protein
MTPKPKPDSFENTLDKLKSYLFQPLLFILFSVATYFLSSINTKLQNMEQIAIQVNIDKTRIDNLERTIYGPKTRTASLDSSQRVDSLFRRWPQTAFKNEEEFDIKKYLKPPYKRNI